MDILFSALKYQKTNNHPNIDSNTRLTGTCTLYLLYCIGSALAVIITDVHITAEVGFFLSFEFN